MLLFFSQLVQKMPTLVYRIDVQYEINVQVGKFLKNIKRAGQNRRAGGKFFLKNNKRAGRNSREGRKFSGKYETHSIYDSYTD